MASREGNVILAPGFSRGTEVKPKEILYSYSRLLQKGVTLMDQGVYEAGTALAYDSGSKKYRKATTAAETVGFLRIATDSSGHPKLANIVLGGVVRTSAIILNGAALADAAAATALATAIGGVANSNHGYIKF